MDASGRSRGVGGTARRCGVPWCCGVPWRCGVSWGCVDQLETRLSTGVATAVSAVLSAVLTPVATAGCQLLVLGTAPLLGVAYAEVAAAAGDERGVAYTVAVAEAAAAVAAAAAGVRGTGGVDAHLWVGVDAHIWGERGGEGARGAQRPLSLALSRGEDGADGGRCSLLESSVTMIVPAVEALSISASRRHQLWNVSGKLPYHQPPARSVLWWLRGAVGAGSASPSPPTWRSVWSGAIEWRTGVTPVIRLSSGGATARGLVGLRSARTSVLAAAKMSAAARQSDW